MEPTIAAIAKKYNVEKKICRVCYARYGDKLNLDYHQKLTIAEKESVVTLTNWESRRSPRIDINNYILVQ